MPEDYLTRAMLAEELDVSRPTLYRHSRRVGSPKPDDYVLTSSGTWPLWSRARLPEWQDYVKLHVRSYTRCGCSPKCADCLARKAAIQSENTAARRAERVLINGKLVHPKAPHGTLQGAKYYGCECTPCRGERNLRERQNRAYKTLRARKVSE